MKQIRKNARRVLFCLCGLFFLLVAYGAYSITTSGGRWFSSSLNTFARKQRDNVIAGDLTDRNGVVLASTNAEGKRTYHQDAQVRTACVHITGDRNGNVTKSMDRVQAAYLYGFNMSFPERLSYMFAGIPRKGDNVQLTVDSHLAAYAASIFPKDKSGAVVVMNYKTGEVLTEQSFPNFDPQGTASALAKKPYTNRAIDGLNAPGSTFKIVTAASAVANLGDYATRTFHCDGLLQLGNRTVTDAGTNLEENKITKHGELNLLRAFQVSCNNTFARIALTLGDQKLRRTAEDFGFNDNFLFRDLIVENSSYPTVNRTDGEIAWTGAGQSALQVSPLHMCLVASAVANRGVMMEPRMLLRAASQGGSVREEFSAKVYRKPLTESQAGVLKEYMRAVVTGGTGKAAQIPGVKVCGKTGSAELDSQKDTNAWFVGFLDEEKSPYALAVVVEDAGGGGAVAAPIARQLFQWLLSNGYGG